MSIVTQERGESRSRIVCDPEHLPLDLKDYEVKKYPEAFSNTLYLGLEDGTFPDGFAFRIRIYIDHKVDQNNVGILDTNLPCFLEIKHPVEGVLGSRKKLRHQTTIKEAIEIAKSMDKVLEIFGSELPENVVQQLKNFYGSGQVVKPLSGVAYERTHFINGHRMTLDKDIHAFSIVEYDGVWFVKSSVDEAYSMLEIKTGEVNGEANVSKFQISTGEVGKLIHIEPGMDMKAEGDWMLLERELKIDTVSDPREGLKVLRSNSEISVGPWKEGSSMMQFVVIGENGICIMGREGVTKKMAIKHKENVESSNGVITRTERVQPYSQEALDQIILSKGGNPEVIERTAYFTRNRAIRLVTCVDTGNIFAITADRCVSEDGRPDLNQTEIEYRGKVTTSDNQVINQDEVDADFQKVSRWLYAEFRKKKLVPQLSSVTKYDWSSSSEQQNGLLEGMRQGNNARIEVNEELGLVAKTYDLWGATDAEETVRNYTKFRSTVAGIYSVPELKKLEVNNSSLKIEESLVEGVLAKQLLLDGSDQQAIDFIHSVLLPLSDQIMIGKEIELANKRVSRCPLITPIDIKPDNFVVTPNGDSFFVDMFPPLNRDENTGIVVDTYPGKGGLNDTLIYGEASVLITRFLMRCIMANPDKAKLMTETVLDDVKKIDQSGMLISQMQENALLEKTITDFSGVKNGILCLALISAA